MAANKKIVSVVDDDLNTTELFQIALSENIEGIVQCVQFLVL